MQQNRKVSFLIEEEEEEEENPERNSNTESEYKKKILCGDICQFVKIIN